MEISTILQFYYSYFVIIQVTGQGMIYVFNPISGAPTEGTPFAGEVLPYNVLQVTMLNQMNDHFLHPLLLLDKDFKVNLC